MKNILAPFGPRTSNEYARAAGGVLGDALGVMGTFGAGLGAVGQGFMQGVAQQGNAYADAYGGLASGLQGMGQSASQGLGYFGQGLSGLGGSQAGAFQGYGQGLAGLANAQAGAYQGYTQGLGGVANAIGQERSNFYNSNSLAEAARQAALGNIGTAALSSYGGAANNALQAWAQNQLAYNQALAGLGTTNQTALSQLGQSRNAALGSLGNAYSSLGGRLGAASAIGNINFNLSDSGSQPTGGGGFQATGPDGEIASGTYGGSSGGLGGLTASGSRVSDTSQIQNIAAPAYAGLSSLRDNLMASDISDSMNRNLADSMNRLDAQHYSSRSMPSQMLGQTLSGLMTLGRDAYGQVRGGMNQFYSTQNDPRNRGDYSGIMNAMGSGFRDVRNDLNASRAGLRSGFNDVQSNLNASRGELTSGYRDMGSRLDQYSNNLRDGFATANRNIGSVIPVLQSGFDKMGASVQDMWDSASRRLFPTLFEQGEDERRNKAAQLVFDYTRAGGKVPDHILRLAGR